MRLLRRFAKAGDERAVQLLRERTSDPSKYVSEAAVTALKLANKCD
jgi:HEAT repeat protein